MDWTAMHPAEQLAQLMRRIYKQGMTTTSGGNISIKDSAGNVWITPSGIDKGNLTRQDIVLIRPDGQVKGQYKPSGEFPFHLAIYEKRPDIKAVLHAHSPALVAFSIIRKLPETKFFPQTYFSATDLGMAEYALAGSQVLAETVARVFAAGKRLVLLENHGIVVGGESLLKAYTEFEALENVARIEIKARQIGQPLKLSTNDINLAVQNPGAMLPISRGRGSSRQEKSYRQKMCVLVRRAREQGLFISSWGTFSQRLTAESFVITPFHALNKPPNKPPSLFSPFSFPLVSPFQGKNKPPSPDYDFLEPNGLVRIEYGCREEGKIPDNAVLLHKEIYQARPYVNAIITAKPPHCMAFVVTGKPFESRTIMESYLFLREVPLLPFECAFTEAKQAAGVLNKNTPVAIIQNYGVIVTGDNILNAYDRLEVMEFNAKTLLAAKAAGVEPVIMDKQSIREIEKLYNL